MKKQIQMNTLLARTLERQWRLSLKIGHRMNVGGKVYARSTKGELIKMMLPEHMET